MLQRMKRLNSDRTNNENTGLIKYVSMCGTYSGLHSYVMAAFQKKKAEFKMSQDPNLSPPKLFDYRHTCIGCSKLGYFTDSFEQSQLVVNVPLASDKVCRQFENGVITNPIQLHCFDVCCGAFGIGNWQYFKQCRSLSEFSDAELEFTAHIRLGVYDLSNFWGLRVWPIQVQQQMRRLQYSHRIVQRSSFINLKDHQDDPVAQLFVDPVQRTNPFAKLNMYQAIRSAVSFEFSLNSQSVQNCWEAIFGDREHQNSVEFDEILGVEDDLLHNKLSLELQNLTINGKCLEDLRSDDPLVQVHFYPNLLSPDSFPQFYNPVICQARISIPQNVCVVQSQQLLSSREEDSGNPEQRLSKLEGVNKTLILAEEGERSRGHHLSKVYGKYTIFPQNADDTEDSDHSWTKEEYDQHMQRADAMGLDYKAYRAYYRRVQPRESNAIPETNVSRRRSRSRSQTSSSTPRTSFKIDQLPFGDVDTLENRLKVPVKMREKAIKKLQTLNHQLDKQDQLVKTNPTNMLHQLQLQVTRSALQTETLLAKYCGSVIDQVQRCLPKRNAPGNEPDEQQ